MSLYDIHSELDPRLVVIGTIVAATDGEFDVDGAYYHDNEEMFAPVIDLIGFNAADLCVSYLADLAEDKELTVKIDYATTNDLATVSWHNATQTTLLDTTVIATGDTGGSIEQGTFNAGLNLEKLSRYIKFYITFNLTNTSTDSAVVSVVANLGGPDTTPV